MEPRIANRDFYTLVPDPAGEDCLRTRHSAVALLRWPSTLRRSGERLEKSAATPPMGLSEFLGALDRKAPGVRDARVGCDVGELVTPGHGRRVPRSGARRHRNKRDVSGPR